MTPDECMKAVTDRSRVVLKTSDGHEQARGRVVSYSIVPTIHIETETGEQIHWRHDMAELQPIDPCVGRKVKVTVVGEIIDHDPATGIYKVRGNADPNRGGHVPWEYEFHWSTEFERLDEVAR